MRSKRCAVPLTGVVVGCGAVGEPARVAAPCDVRLPATPGATRAVLLGSAGLSAEFGFPSTRAEFRPMDFRGVVGEHSGRAARSVARCLRADDGGLHHGGDERGQFRALPLTTGSASARAELEVRHGPILRVEG